MVRGSNMKDVTLHSLQQPTTFISHHALTYTAIPLFIDKNDLILLMVPVRKHLPVGMGTSGKSRRGGVRD